jgi:hypothetical protein
MSRFFAVCLLVAAAGLAADADDDFGFPLDDPVPAAKQAVKPPADDAAGAADGGDFFPLDDDAGDGDDFFPLDDEEDAKPPAAVDFQQILQGVLQEALQDAFQPEAAGDRAGQGDEFLDEPEGGEGNGFLDPFDEGAEAAPATQGADAQVEAVIEGLGAILEGALQEQGGEGKIDVDLEGALKQLQINVNTGQARPEDDDFAVDGGLANEPKFVPRPVEERYAEATAAVFADVKVEAGNGLWYVDGEGVLRLIERETARKRKVPSPGTLFAIEGFKIAHLLPLEDELWAGTNHGLFLFKFSNWSWTRIAVNLLETDVAVNSLVKRDDLLVVLYGDPEQEGRFNLPERRWLQDGGSEAAVPAVPVGAAETTPATPEATAVAVAGTTQPAAEQSLPLFMIVALVGGLVVVAVIVTMLMGRRSEV